MDIQRIVNQVMEVLGRHSYTPEENAIRWIVEKWASNKEHLIELLRKHPNWNEEHLAVVWDYDTEREIDVKTFREHLISMSSRISMRLSDYYSSIFGTLYRISPSKFVDEDICNQFTGFGIAKGQKLSRAVRKILVDSGIARAYDEENNAARLPDLTFEQRMTQMADALSPLAITRHTLLSVHPCDYLHMTYGFSSCHNIDSGCYMAGTLSYMCDKPSMIFYTVSRSFDGNGPYYMQPKINREVFCYDHGVLLQSRLYPDYADELNKDNFRNAVQKIFADCEGVSNSWKLYKSQEKVEKFVYTDDDSKHYPDYEYSQYGANISLLKPVIGNASEDDIEAICIGSAGNCICCGDELSEPGALVCEACSGYVVCKKCGNRVDVECATCDPHGDWYCDDCTRTCEDCGCVIFPYEESYDATSNEYYYHWVCSDCWGNYIYCENCNCLVPDDDGHWIEGVFYCDSCMDELFTTCSECGCIVRYDDATEVSDGSFVCDNCKEKLEEKIEMLEAV